MNGRIHAEDGVHFLFYCPTRSGTKQAFVASRVLKVCRAFASAGGALNVFLKEERFFFYKLESRGQELNRFCSAESDV